MLLTRTVERLRCLSAPTIAYVRRCGLLSCSYHYRSLQVVMPPAPPIEQLRRRSAPDTGCIHRCGRRVAAIVRQLAHCRAADTAHRAVAP